jgi:hypothetical protein
MPRHKGDIEIGHRMVDELVRIFGTKANAIRRLPCERHCLDHWKEGGTPGGYMLARLHYSGGDVMYVLTGVRERRDNA